MRLGYLFLFLLSLTFNALSLEIYINDYRDINYDEITTYHIDDDASDCTCCESEENYFGQDKRYWWE